MRAPQPPIAERGPPANAPAGTPAATPDLARHLAALCADLALEASRPLVERAVRALALALQDGHSCITLQELRAAQASDAAPLPAPAELREALLASGIVGAAAAGAAPAPPLPLVLDGDRLWLRRQFAAERRLLRALRARLGTRPPEPGAAALAALRALAPRGDAVDWQAVAVAAALRGSLCVITGGPGTGKTTTVEKLLQVLRVGAPGLRIALAAPTGKAAARLGEAVQRDAGAAEAAPRATTLHRLLGYLPVEDAFRHHAGAPLPHDVVVVDEASMVDLELMDALFAALLPSARLILLGDQDQLGSVAAGQVLADLCSAAAPAAGVGRELAAFCRAHLGMALPVADAPLGDVVVALRTNWRFAQQPGIGAFAQALAERAPDAALDALRAGHADLRLVEPADLDRLLQPFWPNVEALLASGSAADALAALLRARVLCATRHGPFGVAAANARIESLLRQHGHRTSEPFYRGRPILVTTNDHQAGLYNGDLGVVWPDAAGQLQAWFPAAGGIREVQPLRLPAHETAWAMTVHKSQGSEFDEVLVLLPDRDSPLLNAPLVYTAVTRARARATVVAEPALLQNALAARPARTSGLAAALRSAP